MKISLSHAGTFYTEKAAEKLEELGFEFEKTGFDPRGPMRSARQEDVSIELSTLEDLFEFTKKWGGQLLLDSCDRFGNSITIADDWLD